MPNVLSHILLGSMCCIVLHIHSCAGTGPASPVLCRRRDRSCLACACSSHTQHYQALCSSAPHEAAPPKPQTPCCLCVICLHWRVLLLSPCCPAALCCQVNGDIVVEYVAAPAPDIEELIQQVLPSSSAADGTAADQDAAGEGDGDGDADMGYGGLGLGAAPGLGSTAGLGSSGALGLGFTKASETSTSEAAVDPEVGRGGARGGCSGAVALVAVVACMQGSSSMCPRAGVRCGGCVLVCVWVGGGGQREQLAA